jgi:hypothetical protein
MISWIWIIFYTRFEALAGELSPPHLDELPAHNGIPTG